MTDYLGEQALIRGLRRENSQLKEELQLARVKISLQDVCSSLIFL